MASVRFPINGFKQWHPPSPIPPPPVSKCPAPRYQTPASLAESPFPPNTSSCHPQSATIPHSHCPPIMTPPLQSLPTRPRDPSPFLTDLPISLSPLCVPLSQGSFTTLPLPLPRHPLPGRPPPEACVTPISRHQVLPAPLSHPIGCLESDFSNGESMESPSSSSSSDAPKENPPSQTPGPEQDHLNQEAWLYGTSEIFPSPQVLARDATAISELLEPLILESPIIPIDPALKCDPIYKQPENRLASGGTAAFEAGEDIIQPSLQAIGLPTLYSRWLQASLEEQLQFLSYLFQNALPQCMPESPSVHDIPPTPGPLGTNHVASERSRKQPRRIMPNLNTDELPPNAGKGGRWEAEELALIRELREDRRLPWSEIAKAFDEKWPGRRSQGSIQVKYSTYSGRHKRVRVE